MAPMPKHSSREGLMRAPPSLALCAVRRRTFVGQKKSFPMALR